MDSFENFEIIWPQGPIMKSQIWKNVKCSRVSAVSYTHLDVYKRQMVCCEDDDEYNQDYCIIDYYM